MSTAAFKARCLELMDTVERTGRSIVVTKRGRAVAVLAPVRERRSSAYGFMKGRMQILGDIVAPVEDLTPFALELVDELPVVTPLEKTLVDARRDALVLANGRAGQRTEREDNQRNISSQRVTRDQ